MENSGLDWSSLAGFLDGAFWVAASILALICLSAFFSGSETALTSASRGKLRSRADKGDAAAARALKITANREGLIGAVLLGNNLVNILAASLATSLATRLFGDSGVALATLVMTLLILVFAEVMPKTYALSNPEAAARWVSPVIAAVVSLLSPIVGVIQFIVNQFLRIFGVWSAPQSVSSSVQEEIAGTIALGHSQGAVEKEHRDRILGALDLGDRTIEEVMLHRSEIEAINVDADSTEIFQICTRSPHTRLPIYKGDIENIVGVVHAKDLLRKMLEIMQENRDMSQALSDFNLLDVSMKPYFVPETTTLDEQMREFLDRHSHFAMVVDEYGALQGLVTLEDILEEIVGEIVDEHDTATKKLLMRAKDGTFVVEGATPIRDLNREMDWSLPEEYANTIAGLVIHEAQLIPDAGQEFIFHGFRFEVLNRTANRITRLRLRLL